MSDVLGRSLTLPAPARGENDIYPYIKRLHQSLMANHRRVSMRVEDLVNYGDYADMPTASGSGRFWYDPTLDALYFDSGSWTLIGGSAFGLKLINVKAPVFGAKGDASTDDTTAIQAAANFQATYGGIVYFPPGAYVISSPITVKDGAHWLGHGLGFYALDWTNDFQQADPTYSDHASSIQYESGSHGYILTPNDAAVSARFEGITFRVGQSRTSADITVGATTFSKSEFVGCRFENMYCAHKRVTGFGVMMFRCRFMACTYGLIDIVDSIIEGCQFTSLTEACIYAGVNNGGGSKIVGNRFEWSTYGFKGYQSTEWVLTGNEFDTCDSAVRLNGQNKAATITGNVFRRSGRPATSQLRSHIFLANDIAALNITGNSFSFGVDTVGSPGEVEHPLYVIEADTVTGHVVWRGNSTYNGFVDQPVLDKDDDSNDWLDADCFDMNGFALDAGGNAGDPNGAADTFANAVTDLNRCMFPGHYCVLRLYDDRKCIDNIFARHVILRGVPTAAISLDNNTYTMYLDRVFNIALNNITPVEYDNQTFASQAPSGAGDGSWRTGKIIYDDSPAASGTIGWVYTGSAWKSWGAISA